MKILLQFVIFLVILIFSVHIKQDETKEPENAPSPLPYILINDEIVIDPSSVHCIHWYGEEPDWCIIRIYVGKEERKFCIDKPGKEVMDSWFKKKTLILKIKNNNIDPHMK